MTMKTVTLVRSSFLGACAVLITTQALAADLARVSLDDDWRFVKSDPPGITDNLAYPRAPRSGRGRGGAASNATSNAPAFSPTAGIAQYILPTGDSFIADPAKRYPKPDGNYGADIPYVSPAFDDSSWRQLDLPHDFGIEGPFIPPGQAGSDGGTGRRPFFGAAWYRKHLPVPAADAGKQFYLDLDGAMSYAAVWCNGQIVGGWPYGYSSWRVDLTPAIKPGADNVIAIRLDNPPNSSRWYPGGGIYRNVWLTKSAPVHVGQWGTYVTTPEVSAKSATVNLKVTVNNAAHKSAVVSVIDEIYALDGNNKKSRSAVASITTDNVTVDGASLTAPGEGGSATVESKITIAHPKLWSPTTPNLYLAVTTIKQAGAIVDQYETRFGIRTIKYDPNAGLFVNGEHFKLNGVCDHHDLGSLGTAVNFRALQRQLQILRDMGCNAIRTSHNPPAPELLDFADQMGFLVMDEAFDTWGQNKTPNDYGGGNLFNVWHEQDMRAFVRRDRNHPSVVLWSIGNEIAEQNQGSNSVIAKDLAGIVHAEDPTRPVSAACNDFNAMNNGFATLLDAMGFNYKPDNYIRFHQLYTNEFFFSSESASTISSRGEYFFPVVGPGFGAVNGRGRGGQTNGSQDDVVHQMSSYDLYYPGWATSPDHEFFGQDHSQAVAGEFVWTGFDYIGEPTPWGGRNDPSRSSYFGIVDLAGFPKDRFYLYQAHWRPALPLAHIVPQNWTWPDRAGQVTPVHIYTSGDEAELFLNGKSLGRKKKTFETPNNPRLNGEPAYRIRWDDVVYQPGELKVVAYKNGRKWATDTVKTAGDASRLVLKADRSTIAGDGHDISFVKLTVFDKAGVMVPRANQLIHFSVTGPGEIIATDNGDATDLASFQDTDRKAFNGLALAIVKAKRGQRGAITVTATSEGLTPAKTTITIK
jgi:beta-galactosidase